MAILITGGAGFIGRHTAKLFRAAGHHVVVLDHQSPRSADRADFIRGDINDTALVRHVLRDYGITAVVHLAASAHVGDSMANPAFYYANNVVGTASLIEAMISEDVLKLVFASSCSVYGNSASSAALEDEPVIPMSPYGESKLVTERSLPWYSRAQGLDWVALRYFNVAGAEDGLGEDLAGCRRIIPRTIHAATGEGPALSVFGTTFDTPDGSALRDFVHVADVAQANLLALGYVERGNEAAVMNIGAGVGISVLQIIDEVAAQTGRSVPYRVEAAHPGDPACAISDTSRARRLLGWNPTVSSIDSIVASVLHSAKLRAAELVLPAKLKASLCSTQPFRRTPAYAASPPRRSLR